MRGEVVVTMERYVEVHLSMTREQFEILEDTFSAGKHGGAYGRSIAERPEVREVAEMLYRVRTKMREQLLDTVKHEQSALSPGHRVEG
jgi:hypothetical protein